MKNSRLGLIILLAFLLTECSVVPITGRKQMNLLLAVQMVEMGFNIYDAFLKENKLSGKQNAARMVEDKTPNAWYVPGGKVVFYEGILPYTRDENGIAVVMGHEIAHAIAKHGNERMGLIFMAMAGYDPNEAIGFWERMSQANQNQQPFEFLSTHPLTETRIADMKANLPEAMTYFKRVNP